MYGTFREWLLGQLLTNHNTNPLMVADNIALVNQYKGLLEEEQTKEEAVRNERYRKEDEQRNKTRLEQEIAFLKTENNQLREQRYAARENKRKK